MQIKVCLGANLKLFQACIVSFQKFCPYGAKIHWLFNNSVVGPNLWKQDIDQYFGLERNKTYANEILET